ncbi:hypothetical protein [Micromonospora peucetia]|uniref:Uncharacterized protein n=1 Tax=Micromonospora peucetia TaxID=47871 RepID=A0ABZ1E9C6_9ACTN|nr:hypothetical protein [Micromonospora peucetia]WSA30424.1 hypothetical protein OIE14_19735 [Micromonospora peucetia]
MEALAVHDVRVAIFHGHFTLRDVWCDAGDDGESLRVSRERVVAASTYQVTIQARPQVAGLRIRLWDSEPEQDSGTWDGCRQLVLHCPTGNSWWSRSRPEQRQRYGFPSSMVCPRTP